MQVGEKKSHCILKQNPSYVIESTWEKHNKKATQKSVVFIKILYWAK